MSDTLVILAMAAVTFLIRFAGLSMSRVRLSPFWDSFLRFVPVSVFAALVTPSLLGQSVGETGVRVLAAALAAFALWRVRQFWAGLLVGMAVFWALRALL